MVNTRKFKIVTSKRKEDITVFLSGDLDMSTSRNANEQIQSIASSCSGKVVLDLGKVTYIDSEWVRSILRAKKILLGQQKSMTITRCSKPVYKIFHLIGADSIPGLFDNELIIS